MAIRSMWWTSHEMRVFGAAAVERCVQNKSVDDLEYLVNIFCAKRAGQAVLRRLGISNVDALGKTPSAESCAQTARMLLGEGSANQATSSTQLVSQPINVSSSSSSSDAASASDDDEEDAGEAEEMEQDEEEAEPAAAVVETSGTTRAPSYRGRGGRGRGGRGSCSLSNDDLRAWVSTLQAHPNSKCIGVSTFAAATNHRKEVQVAREDRHAVTETNMNNATRRNEANTQATLELHSAGASRLDGKVDSFLQQAVSYGLNRINVITGKGTHGGPGTVRIRVAQILLTHPLVKQFEVARNFSAYYVDLHPAAH